MDPAVASLLTEASKLGFVVLLLVVAVVCLVRWVKRLEDERKVRETEAAARCKTEIEAAVKRIQFLEDRAHNEQQGMLDKCMDTLQTNARAFEHLVELERGRATASGAHRTVREA